MHFDTGGASLEGVSARLGGGPVRFGGRVTFTGVSPSEFNVTATGYEMRIRYPEGFRSIIDAQLALRGPVAQPTLSGTVNVRDAVLTRAIDTSGTGVFGLAAGGLATSDGGHCRAELSAAVRPAGRRRRRRCGSRTTPPGSSRAPT